MTNADVKLAARPLSWLLLQLVVRVLRSLSLRAPELPHLLEDKRAEQRGYVVYRGHRLPPKSMRGRMCGDAFRTDSFFFLSGVLEAKKFAARLGYTNGSRVVDIGSGLGRLAIGLQNELGDVNYLGIDANEGFVRWCKDNIQQQHPSFRFVHLDMVNELYNPAGSIDARELRLPVGDASADIVYLWGVFTNMVPAHVESYVAEIARVLRPRGLCFLSAFVEEDVPDVTFNPADYVPYDCDAPLIVVRYSRDWLFSLLAKHGLRVEDFRYHGTIFPKHSEIYVAKTETEDR